MKVCFLKRKFFKEGVAGKMVATKTQYNNGYRLPIISKNDKAKPKEHSQFVYSLIYHRVEILLGIIIFIMIISMLFAAHCDKTWEDFGGADPPQKVGNVLGLVVDEGGMIDKIFGANRTEEYANLLSVTASGTSFSIGGVDSLEGLSSVLSAVNELFKVIGWGLALIFWGYSFAEMMMQSNGQLIVEQVIKKLLFLVICYFVIENSLEFCCEIVNAGTELTTATLESFTSIGMESSVAEYKEEVFNACWKEETFMGINWGFFSTTIAALGYVVQLFFPWLIALACDVIVKILCWSRAIEICILAAISPIMFMDLGSARELTHSSTARAIKNLIALAMQGALILISLAICQSIMQSIVGNSELSYADQVWDIVLISALQVGTIGKTQALAKQALGIG